MRTSHHKLLQDLLLSCRVRASFWRARMPTWSAGLTPILTQLSRWNGSTMEKLYPSAIDGGQHMTLALLPSTSWAAMLLILEPTPSRPPTFSDLLNPVLTSILQLERDCSWTLTIKRH